MSCRFFVLAALFAVCSAHFRLSAVSNIYTGLYETQLGLRGSNMYGLNYGDVTGDAGNTNMCGTAPANAPRQARLTAYQGTQTALYGTLVAAHGTGTFVVRVMGADGNQGTNPMFSVGPSTQASSVLSCAGGSGPCPDGSTFVLNVTIPTSLGAGYMTLQVAYSGTQTSATYYQCVDVVVLPVPFQPVPADMNTIETNFGGSYKGSVTYPSGFPMYGGQTCGFQFVVGATGVASVVNCTTTGAYSLWAWSNTTITTNSISAIPVTVAQFPGAPGNRFNITLTKGSDNSLTVLLSITGFPSMTMTSTKVGNITSLTGASAMSMTGVPTSVPTLPSSMLADYAACMTFHSATLGPLYGYYSPNNCPDNGMWPASFNSPTAAMGVEFEVVKPGWFFGAPIINNFLAFSTPFFGRRGTAAADGSYSVTFNPTGFPGFDGYNDTEDIVFSVTKSVTNPNNGVWVGAQTVLAVGDDAASNCTKATLKIWDNVVDFICETSVGTFSSAAFARSTSTGVGESLIIGGTGTWGQIGHVGASRWSIVNGTQMTLTTGKFETIWGPNTPPTAGVNTAASPSSTFVLTLQPGSRPGAAPGTPGGPPASTSAGAAHPLTASVALVLAALAAVFFA